MFGLDKQKSNIVLAVIVVLIIVVIAVAYRHYNSSSGSGSSSKSSSKSNMQNDAYNWPSAGQFGAMADTYPYGNYAGHVDMYYPTYNPR